MNSTLGQTNRVGKLLAVFWVVLLGTFANAQSAGDAGRAVLATHPLAYYRLEAAQGNSETGSTQYHLTAGARSSPGGISAGKEGHFALMDGRSGMVDNYTDRWHSIVGEPDGMGEVGFATVCGTTNPICRGRVAKRQ